MTDNLPEPTAPEPEGAIAIALQDAHALQLIDVLLYGKITHGEEVYEVAVPPSFRWDIGGTIYAPGQLGNRNLVARVTVYRAVKRGDCLTMDDMSKMDAPR